MEQSSARGLALAALREWRKGHEFADSILQRLLAQVSLGISDRGFATELFYGVLRNLTLLDFWISLLRSASVDAASRDLLPEAGYHAAGAAENVAESDDDELGGPILEALADHLGQSF